MKNLNLHLVAPDILIEQDSIAMWLTQGGKHYPFPLNMEFRREVVDLAEEGYITGGTFDRVDTVYGQYRLTLIRMPKSSAH